MLLGTQPLGPSRMATVERALLDAASRPQLSGGASRVAEALAAVKDTTGVLELAREAHDIVAYRRIGSLATTLSLAVGRDLEPVPWKTLIELDRNARGEKGWVDKIWGVAWPYPASQLEAVVAA